MPLPWLESQALFVLQLMLQQCHTQYELGKLLQLFAAAQNLLLDGEDTGTPAPVAGLAPEGSSALLGSGPALLSSVFSPQVPTCGGSVPSVRP